MLRKLILTEQTKDYGLTLNIQFSAIFCYNDSEQRRKVLYKQLYSYYSCKSIKDLNVKIYITNQMKSSSTTYVSTSYNELRITKNSTRNVTFAMQCIHFQLQQKNEMEWLQGKIRITQHFNTCDINRCS